MSKIDSPLLRLQSEKGETKESNRETLTKLYHAKHEESTPLHYCYGCGRCFKPTRQDQVICKECIYARTYDGLYVEIL